MALLVIDRQEDIATGSSKVYAQTSPVPFLSHLLFTMHTIVY